MIHFDSRQSQSLFNQNYYENAMASYCRQCFYKHYQPHCHPTTESLWLCSSVYCGSPHQSRRIWLTTEATNQNEGLALAMMEYITFNMVKYRIYTALLSSVIKCWGNSASNSCIRCIKTLCFPLVGVGYEKSQLYFRIPPSCSSHLYLAILRK